MNMQNETPNPQWQNEPKDEIKAAALEEEKSIPEVSQTAESTLPGGESIPAEPIVPQPKKEGGFKRFLRFLFGPDTKMGRFMRPFLRGLAGIVIAFAAGLLIAYFAIYIPLRAQYDTVVNTVQQMNTTLQEDQITITSLQGEITALEATMAGQQAEIELSNYRVYFLIVKNDVMRARLALADEKNGPGGPTTKAALDDLEKHLADLLPYVQSDDPVLADLLTGRLDVVQNELVRDSKQAKLELDDFYTNLLELEPGLFE